MSSTVKSPLCLWLLSVFVVTLWQQQGAMAVPSNANRMVPSWWQFAKSLEVCYKESDCSEGECCARPMMSAKSYCMPLKQRAQFCDSTPYLLNQESKIYFADCPCDSHLTCTERNAASVCVGSRQVPDIYKFFGLSDSDHQ